MTNPSVRKPAPRHSHEPISRHYHESGNLGRRVKKTCIPSFPQKQKTKIRNLKSRHSRAGGNPVRSVSVVSDKFLLLFISRFPLSWE
ncbi:hypothetical protein COI33_05890 [Neisseria meningitidis]|nr:hypothetical protein COI33_05890 [Neisseria meningitidis]RQL35009.1 hypothetical protein COH26_03450 [Neisseria meningitidis]